MPEVLCIGEFLIDFVSIELDKPIGECREFIKAAGGAPANVAVGLSILDIRTGFIGKVGGDDFGYFLRNILIEHNVDVEYLVLDRDIRTTLAFIATRSDGGKSILFYRNPGADMMLTADEIDIQYIKSARILHFGSVSMSSGPSREATFHAIKTARKNNITTSFDPNLRMSLWESEHQAKTIVLEAVRFSDIVKCNMGELEIITGTPEWQKGADKLLDMGAKLVVITDAEKGCYFKNGVVTGSVPAFSVNPVDSLGAGDSFTASLLYKILRENIVRNLNKVEEKNLYEIVRFSNAAGAMATLKKGAIPTLPRVADIERFIEENETSV